MNKETKCTCGSDTTGIVDIHSEDCFLVDKTKQRFEEVVEEFRDRFIVFGSGTFKKSITLNDDLKFVAEIICFLRYALTTHGQKMYKQGRADIEKEKQLVRYEIENKIPNLRQWLNERPENRAVTNNDIRYWLGLELDEEEDEQDKKIKDYLEKQGYPSLVKLIKKS